MVQKMRDDNGFFAVPLISVPSSILPIPSGPPWNEHFGKPGISQDRNTGNVEQDRNASSFRWNVFRWCSRRLVTLTSLGFFWHFHTSRLFTVWSMIPTQVTTNYPAGQSLIHLLAMDSFWRTIRLLLKTKWILFFIIYLFI